MRPTLRRVLIVAFAAVAAGAVALTAIITLGLTRVGAPARAVAALRTEAANAASVASGLPCDTAARPGAQLAQEFGPRVRFVPDGVRGRVARNALASAEGHAKVLGRDVYYSSVRTTICGRQGTLYVIEQASQISSLPEGFGGRLAIAALAAVAVSALVAFALAKRLSKPLGDLAASARAFAKGSRSPSTPSASDPAEVIEVKGAFEQMMTDLEAADEREKGFLLSVSHELRTPLTAIRGYGEALSDGTSRKPAEAGAVIVRESQRLERLVQDLLDLARLEAGEFSVEMSDVDLAEVAGDVQRGLQPLATASGLSIAVDATPSVVRTDRDRVHQMAANLVENALRVSAPGSTVRIATEGAGLSVSDEGPGIASEDLAHAFDRFYLWRKYRGERPVGSGLGLAIVAELARRLGAEVDVRSQQGGSTFEITFPS